MFLIRNITNINVLSTNRTTPGWYGLSDDMVFEREIISTFYRTKHSERFLIQGIPLTSTSGIWN